MKKEEFDFKKFLIEFLRLNRWKLITLLILIFVLIYITFFYFRLSCDFGGCPPPPKQIKFIYEFLFIFDNKLLESIFSDNILIVLELIYLYLLSCLTFMIFHKIKENVKNK